MKRLTLLFTCFFLSMVLAIAQNTNVSGQVVDEKGEAIIGASVIAKGTTVGTVTDMDGKFTLSVPSTSKTLLVRYIGMKDQEVVVAPTLRVVLVEATTDLDEIVVMGYTSRKRGAITGAVSTVKAEQAAKMPVANFQAALQGTAAGVQVSTPSGRPGATSVIRVRGLSSINAGVDPLYVIDGVVATSSDFSSLNSKDIESVSVLKDASATALYGSRGANGVVLITTKRGSTSGRAEVTYNGFLGSSKKTKPNFTLMNAEQKLDYELFIGLKTQAQVDDLKAKGINTNWVDELTGETGKIQSHTASVRGGSTGVRYYGSLSYLDFSGILLNSDLQNYSGRFNLDADATKSLKVGFNLNLSHQDAKNTITSDLSDSYANGVYNPAFRGLLENPYVAPYKEDGSYTTTADGLKWGNPIEHLLLNPTNYNNFNFLGSAFAELSFFDHFKFKTLLGVDYRDNTTDGYVSPNSVWGKDTKGSVSRGFGRTQRIVNTNTLQYGNVFNDVHDVSILLGQETTKSYTDAFYVNGKGLPNDQLKVLGVTTEYDGKPSTASIKSEYTLASFFGAVNYNYEQKYFVDLSLRVDGSSRFGKDNRWGTFGSVGLMWNLLSEDFISVSDKFSDLKLRTSYGLTGNFNIPNYDHIPLYAVSGTYNNQSAGYLATPGNPDLTWEKVGMFDLGVDLTYDRLSVSAGYYYKKTTDMLFEVPFSHTTGFAEGWKNIGAMKNEGFELKADLALVKTNDLKWEVGLVYGYNHNRILELYGDEDEYPDLGTSTVLKVGSPYGASYYNRYAGVNPANGKTLWLDKNGAVTETFRADDAVELEGKSWIPSSTGGFNTKVNYKGIELQADFTFMSDFWILNNAALFIRSQGGFAAYGQDVKMLDYWKQPGDIAKNPDPRLAQNEFDDRLLEDASFLRFRSLLLSYDLPSKLVKKSTLFQKVKFFAQGFNLYTWTKYTGYDPEQYGPWEMGGYPQVRSFVFGVEVGF